MTHERPKTWAEFKAERAEKAQRIRISGGKDTGRYYTRWSWDYDDLIWADSTVWQLERRPSLYETMQEITDAREEPRMVDGDDLLEWIDGQMDFIDRFGWNKSRQTLREIRKELSRRMESGS